jgi:C-terminal processing protease CtpA/Prc
MQTILITIIVALASSACLGEQLPGTVSPTQVDAIVKSLISGLGDYVFPETAARMQSSIREHQAEYRTIRDPHTLAFKLTDDLRATGNDKHLQVTFGEELGIRKEPTPAEKQHAHAFDLASGHGVRSVRRLPGNIGYLNLAFFSPDADAAQAIAAAMKLVNGTDALILDLRHNGGGSGDTATALVSYFFEEPVQLSSIVERKHGSEMERQKWSLRYVEGPKYLDKPIYILVSSHTHSAAEFCAYDLQAAKRAVVLGGRTSGDATSGEGVTDLGYGFTVFIPNGQTRNPITHSNWRLTGVQPDVPAQDAEVLSVAYRKALHESGPSLTDSEELKQERQNALKDPQAALNEETTAIPNSQKAGH